MGRQCWNIHNMIVRLLIEEKKQQQQPNNCKLDKVTLVGLHLKHIYRWILQFSQRVILVVNFIHEINLFKALKVKF